jgi:hypothetical protein
MQQNMIMEGVGVGGLVLEPNPVCASYVDAAVRNAEIYLAPLSILADCGKLGFFDLSKVDGASELREQFCSSQPLYNRLWRSVRACL